MWQWWSPVLQNTLIYWMAGVPIVTGLGAWIHKVTERRHRERLSVLRETRPD